MRRSRGFALIIVLWGLVVIGLLVTHLAATGRTEAKIAANLIANAEAASAADGGIATAVFHLSHRDPALRWSADGSPHTVRIGSASVIVRSVDESGKVNPNLAPESLMSALLRVTGVDPSQAERLAAAIASWHDLVRQSKPGGVGPNDYADAGLDYAPPGSSIESLDELNRVLGMTPAILAKLRPHLSLWTRLLVPPRNAADPVVAEAIDMARGSFDNTLASPPQPAQWLMVSIVSASHTADGASFTRDAVVQIGPSLKNGYQILAWDQDRGD